MEEGCDDAGEVDVTADAAMAAAAVVMVVAVVGMSVGLEEVACAAAGRAMSTICTTGCICGAIGDCEVQRGTSWLML